MSEGFTYYASNMGAGRNREACRAAGFGVLLNPLDPGHWNPDGLRYCIDNGAWGAFLTGQRFREEPFERLLDYRGAGADFVVLPDIVAGGLERLALSLRWSNRALASGAPLVLIAVQNGMTAEHLAPYVGPRVGIFLGGSTDWKLATMGAWGDFAAERAIHYHVARVNTVRRMAHAIGAGANSADGSSASRFRVTVPKLRNATGQPDMLCPRRNPSNRRALP